MSNVKVFQSGEEVGPEYQEIGHVSVSGQATVDDATNALVKEAEEKGADALKITAVGGDNKLHGNGVIYQLSQGSDSAEDDAE